MAPYYFDVEVHGKVTPDEEGKVYDHGSVKGASADVGEGRRIVCV